MQSHEWSACAHAAPEVLHGKPCQESRGLLIVHPSGGVKLKDATVWDLHAQLPR